MTASAEVKLSGSLTGWTVRPTTNGGGGGWEAVHETGVRSPREESFASAYGWIRLHGTEALA